jgi:hypothetical protein
MIEISRIAQLWKLRGSDQSGDVMSRTAADVGFKLIAEQMRQVEACFAQELESNL